MSKQELVYELAKRFLPPEVKNKLAEYELAEKKEREARYEKEQFGRSILESAGIRDSRARRVA